ncbi:MAG TPA: DUF3105 domain-containing protein [Gaiellaceae bacterium]|nr:DUF3105 domain-containing protein [Gaiellaceae bacterium]
MAKKKPRTPPPPRVQAPRTRTSTKTPAESAARQRALLYALAGSGVVALVIVVGVFAFGGSGGGANLKSAATTIQNQGCTYKRYPALARTPHYATLTPSPPPAWNSFPPTSGRHYFQPLIFNQYADPVLEIQAVHNLEHGAMILQYGNKIPQAQVDAITAWYRKDPNAIVVAPLPKLGDKVAMTAWTYWAECTGFDVKAANAFKVFRYRAPEKFPKSYLNPGQ